MRRVVVNTTPLIALSEIGKLNILKDMYGEIFIPKAVYDEVKLEPAYSEVNSSLDWINVVDIDNNVYAKMFSTRLHAGEVEAIMYAIAIEEKGSLDKIEDEDEVYTISQEYANTGILYLKKIAIRQSVLH